MVSNCSHLCSSLLEAIPRTYKNTPQPVSKERKNSTKIKIVQLETGADGGHDDGHNNTHFGVFRAHHKLN